MSFKHYKDRIELQDKKLRLGNGASLERRNPSIWDHFTTGAGALNSAVPQTWVNTQAGSGTLFVSGATGGTYAIGVSGATTDNAVELAGKGVLWNPSTMGGLTLEVRAKFVGATTATDGDFLIGFSDAVTQTSSLAYVVGADSAITTSAPAEFVGFYYSSIPTSGTLYGASGNKVGMINSIASVDTVTGTTTVKDSSFHIYRIEVGTDGSAKFWIDDVGVGYVAAAVTANTAFTPYIAAIAKNSHAHTATVDYIMVSAGKCL